MARNKKEVKFEMWYNEAEYNNKADESYERGYADGQKNPPQVATRQLSPCERLEVAEKELKVAQTLHAIYHAQKEKIKALNELDERFDFIENNTETFLKMNLGI